MLAWPGSIHARSKSTLTGPGDPPGIEHGISSIRTGDPPGMDVKI